MRARGQLGMISPPPFFPLYSLGGNCQSGLIVLGKLVTNFHVWLNLVSIKLNLEVKSVDLNDSLGFGECIFLKKNCHFVFFFFYDLFIIELEYFPFSVEMQSLARDSYFQIFLCLYVFSRSINFQIFPYLYKRQIFLIFFEDLEQISYKRKISFFVNVIFQHRPPL